MGLASAVAFFSIAKNNKRWGKRRWFAPKKSFTVNSISLERLVVLGP